MSLNDAARLSDETLVENVRDNGCSDSFSELSRRYENLYFKVCHKYVPAFSVVGIDPQDIFDDKDRIFLDCIHKYNLGEKVKFSTYAGNRARWHCLNSINRRNKIAGEPESLKEHLIDKEVKCAYEELGNQECYQTIRELYKSITDSRAKKILGMRYFGDEPKTWRVIAKEMNTSVQTAIHIHNQALKVLKSKLKSKDNL